VVVTFKLSLTNQHPTFYMPDALPDVQPTVSRHWRTLHIAALQY